jgi:dolichol-phosphate mannosyltransferase
MNGTTSAPEPIVRHDRAGRALVSVVLSFRNEADVIPVLIARLDAVLTKENVQYELIFVNDASTDASVDILLRERERNPRVKIVNMSRRFGVAECLLAGLAATSGDAVVYLDTDLQDPPQVIPRLLERWRAGADVVHTVRSRRRGESAIKMWITGAAYRVIQFGSPLKLPVDAGDFKLLSRAVVDHVIRFRETDPYMRGLVVWVGFTQAFVTYEREPRQTGSTHFPLFSRGPLKAFVVGLTSFSFLPVYACVVMAIAGLLGAVALSLLAIGLAVTGNPSSSVWIAAAIAFLWATAVGSSSIVGLYVVRIYKDVRGRPPFIIESTVGLPAPASRDSLTAERGRS